ncbi:type II toxin-antitoxin system VapC family toxin [Methylocystis iwaonis]|uniref:DNA-binding protein n=1 Tax=Methylocystis iwaonis TaxID=2885079 RepID=A0ABN6VIX5_9HYPH|nr:type II toxin-antitoxin system VapC family toxin [Methylocystis iwaonis]BDV34187.1 DNA-binding protein [Methylocystis iwaonis]
MLAIDTNVLVRFLVKDDPEQSLKARALIEQETIFVALTVLLEAEWVLRSAYRFERERLLKAFRAFAGLKTVVIQDPRALSKAIAWAEAGMDFADALHLAQMGQSEAFATFDARLAKAAKRMGAAEVRGL